MPMDLKNIAINGRSGINKIKQIKHEREILSNEIRQQEKKEEYKKKQEYENNALICKRCLNKSLHLRTSGNYVKIYTCDICGDEVHY